MTHGYASQPPVQRPYILGLDIGANSIGWVCLAAEPDGTGWEPTSLLHGPEDMHRWPTLGVRLFPVGVANFDTGDEEGPGVQRRRMRLMRRQTMRRARRMQKTFHLLQQAGLLPAYPKQALERRAGAKEAVRDEVLKALDARLAKRWQGRVPHGQAAHAHDMLPYLLRTRALDEPLELEELGRAFYHLAQRRGFLSNRRDADSQRPGRVAPAKDGQDDPRALKAQMDELGLAMQSKGHRTLGEHLYWRVADERLPVRKLKTRRWMYRDEFERIWEAQAKHHPALLSGPLRSALEHALFHQRPLADQSEKIGICSLEDGANHRIEPDGRVRRTRAERRAPVCDLLFQRFRMLQRVNDLRVLSKATGEIRGLTADERERLIEALGKVKSMSATDVGKCLGWKTAFKAQINFDDETGSALSGLWTHAQLTGIFGERWRNLAAADQDEVVRQLFQCNPSDWYDDDPDDPRPRQRDPAIARMALTGKGVWGKLAPSRNEAQLLIDVQISPAYASVSRRAIRRLLPLLETGKQFKHAADECYLVKQSQVFDFLPPVNKIFRSMNNPVVMRCLTELRRVMEHLVKLYGKPAEIRMELARDVQQGRKGREEARDAQRENLKAKNKAVLDYCRQFGIEVRDSHSFRGGDLVRLRLWVEQEYSCPYTTRTISASQVLTAECEVDHILPFSRSQDDSYGNKVLCLASANAQKGQKIPHEAWGNDLEAWARIKGWVESKRKQSSMSLRKLDKLLFTSADAADYLDGFRARQLNDTRWAARWAKRYVMHLYGGDVGLGVDAEGRRRILVSGGTATAHLRREKGLEKILKRVIDPSVPLPPRGFTKRIDHRHHAIDAFAIAWCGPRMHAAMSRAAEAAPNALRRFYEQLQDPWPNYEADLEAALSACVPSHRVSARVRGALHKETIYSPATITSGERKSNVVVGTAAHRRRNMDHAGNHHVIVNVMDGEGRQIIDVSVVSKWEAITRLQSARTGAARLAEPSAARNSPMCSGAPYDRRPQTLFTASIGDALWIPATDSRAAWLGIIRILKQDKRITISPIHETRTPRTPKGGKRGLSEDVGFLETCIPLDGLQVSLERLVRQGCRKVTISPIGVVRPSRA